MTGPSGTRAGVVVAAFIAGALGGTLAGVGVAVAYRPSAPAPVATTAPGEGSVDAVSAGTTRLEIKGGDSEAIKAAIATVDPSVVNVTTHPETLVSWWGEPLEVPGGQGTGFVVDAKRGLILTNQHVVQTDQEPRIKMLQPNGKSVELQGFTVARSPRDDVALVRVDAENLPQAELGDSKSLKVGDWVVAIGSPFGLDHTATVGVVSALQRRFTDGRSYYEDMVQTDAAINSGNSGGPLIDLAGRVIGMNTMITSPSGASAGVGFAIASEKLARTKKALLSANDIGVQIGSPSRRWLMLTRAPDGYPCQVQGLVEGGSAAAAGMQEGDVLLKMGGHDITSPDEMLKVIDETEPNTMLPVSVYRYDPQSGRGGTVELKVKVVRRGDM